MDGTAYGHPVATDTEPDCMSVRPPTFSDRKAGLQSGAGILEAEILAEMAASLGRAGRALEKALVQLSLHEAACRGDEAEEQRQLLLQIAADAAWALLIQYELSGLSSQTQLVKRYGIPPDVLVRVGVR